VESQLRSSSWSSWKRNAAGAAAQRASHRRAGQGWRGDRGGLHAAQARARSSRLKPDNRLLTRDDIRSSAFGQLGSNANITRPARCGHARLYVAEQVLGEDVDHPATSGSWRRAVRDARAEAAVPHEREVAFCTNPNREPAPSTACAGTCRRTCAAVLQLVAEGPASASHPRANHHDAQATPSAAAPVVPAKSIAVLYFENIELGAGE